MLGRARGPCGRFRALNPRTASRKVLEGDGAGLDADTPDATLLLQHGHALAQLGGLDGGTLPGKAAECKSRS